MESGDKFQGVICTCIASGKSFEETIIKLLDIRKTSTQKSNITCFDLELENKYYKSTIHLFNYDLLTNREIEGILEECQAIIIYADGQTLTIEQLDSRVEMFKAVGGEPRILLYEGIDRSCNSYDTFIDWCIKNGYAFLNINEDSIRSQIVDSLSAHKWVHRTDQKPKDNTPRLDGDMLKKLVDFDSLLGKLSAYREKPELRGDPNDKNIEEIAEILSGLLGDDIDNFLENDDHENEESVTK